MTATGICCECGRETSCYASRGQWRCVECRFGCSVEDLMSGTVGKPAPADADRQPGETRQAWRMRLRQAGGA